MSSSYYFEWRVVDPVPVHRHLNPFIELEDHHGILQITAWTHIKCHQYTRVLKRWTVQQGDSKMMTTYWPVDVVNMRTDSERVHPVPEGFLLSALTWRDRTVLTRVETYFLQWTCGIKVLFIHAYSPDASPGSLVWWELGVCWRAWLRRPCWACRCHTRHL